MPTAIINGGEIYFERHGDHGEPLVLVHGYTGDLSDWRHQLPAFAATHRVLIMDHRGHGRSHAPNDRDAYSIAHMASDVEELVAHAGFDRYHLVGHSMGGAISQEIALRSPARLLSLTLEDTGPSFVLDNPAVLAFLENRFKLAEEQGMAAVANIQGLPPPPHMPPGRRAEEQARLSAMAVDGFIGAWRGLTSWPGTRDRAHTITAPTMVIYGELDAGLIEGMKFLATTITAAVEEVVPEAAHSPQFERPDIFNDALRRHLHRNAGAGAK